MKKLCLLTLLAVLFSLQAESQSSSKPDRKVFHGHQATEGSRGSFTYLFSVLNEPYEDLTGATSLNQNDLWDDPAYTVSIPFPFELNGNPISYVEFFGTGMFFQSATSNPDIGTYVFPFEVDLIDRGYVGGVSMSPISYKVDGAAGSRILKVEMKNAGSYIEYDALGTTDMYVNLQMWLYETSNRVEFRFGESLISNPAVFYADGGALSGITDYDMVNDVLINGHFLGGSAAAPQLNMSDVTLEGTPDDGTVYRFSLTPPVELVVTGQNANSFCNPDGSATATVTGGTAPFTYLWSNGETTPTITNLDAGVYSVTVTDASGESATGSVTITNVNPLNPNAGSTDETGVGLNDGTAFSAAFGGTPPYSYAWSNGEDTQVITGLAPGVYTVLVTDDAGCTSTQSVSVNAFGCEEITVEAITVNASCAGICNGQVQILGIFGGTGPYTFLWSNGSTAMSIDNLCAAEYELTVTDANGCIEITSFVITEPAILVAGAGSTPEYGNNANNGTAWALPSGGTAPYSYAWSNSSTDSLVTNLAPGAYFLTITDFNGCLDSQSVVIAEFICSLSHALTVFDAYCYGQCTGSAEVDIANGVGPYAVLWSNGDTLEYADELCAGNSSVLITDLGTGCTNTDTFTIAQPDSLTAAFLIVHLTDSTEASIDIKVLGGTPEYFYIWSGPNGYLNNAEDISGLEAGYYSVLVSDLSGCSIAIDSIEIEDNRTVGTTAPQEVDVRVYPNPAGDQLTIDLPDLTGYEISLRALDGRVAGWWNEERIINIRNVPTGMFVLEGISKTGIFRTRIVIAR